jgi:hypothetical protein
MLRIVRTLSVAGAVAVAAGACGGDSPTGNNNTDEVVGVYILQTINGQSLPVIVEQVDSDMVEVIAGTVTLDADATFDDVTELRITEAGVVTTETEAASGTWTLSGTTVQFNPTGFTAYSMTWDGADRLTQVLGAFTLVYER